MAILAPEMTYTPNLIINKALLLFIWLEYAVCF